MWQSTGVLKKHVKYIKNKFEQFSQYQITLPSQSGYEGYCLIMPNSLVSVDNSLYFSINFPPDYQIKLVKQERENGKKYPRPQVSVETIINIFRESEQVSLKKGLAITSDYEYKGAFKTQGLEIGYVDDTWFYSMNREERKRRNAYGFKLVMELDEKTDAEAEQFLENYKAYEQQSIKADLKIEKFKKFLIDTRYEMPFNEYYGKITKCTSIDVSTGSVKDFLNSAEQDFLLQLFEQRRKLDIEHIEKQKPFSYIEEAIKTSISGKEEIREIREIREDKDMALLIQLAERRLKSQEKLAAPIEENIKTQENIMQGKNQSTTR